ILSLDSDSNAWPEPHSALIHLDHLKVEHSTMTREIMQLFGDSQRVDTGADHFLIESRGFRDWLNTRENEFVSWFDYFRIKYQQVVDDGADRPPFPEWNHIWAALNHWADFVKIKVLNSDRDLPRTPLDFDPRSDGDGNPIAPRDIYTIVIGGNSLARGLTIDGLCTTIFGRVSTNPNQATMMQHQRWCGYRAHYWEYVTLHIEQHALDLMSSWSAADRLSRQSNALGTLVPLRMTLMNINGRRVRGAGKLNEPISLHLWGDYQFRHVELNHGESNEKVMSEFIERVLQNPQLHGPHVVNVENTMSAIDVANMLDQMEYSTTGTKWNTTGEDGGRREWEGLGPTF
ncbi:Z1 domain-containing protein, partial [Candidatus Poseidoniales archaeon]|nr:Z1 domain-containing protein [Candidatus Poseidoniales archaeon]